MSTTAVTPSALSRETSLPASESAAVVVRSALESSFGAFVTAVFSPLTSPSGVTTVAGSDSVASWMASPALESVVPEPETSIAVDFSVVVLPSAMASAAVVFASFSECSATSVRAAVAGSLSSAMFRVSAEMSAAVELSVATVEFVPVSAVLSDGVFVSAASFSGGFRAAFLAGARFGVVVLAGVDFAAADFLAAVVLVVFRAGVVPVDLRAAGLRGSGSDTSWSPIGLLRGKM
ncbi:hypothetical protein [Nocardia macrotermitis]|uniref:hypothetical protein n=1 Tax=Nocardia macrotermitis TaxID=2585198 RepID=UPI0012970780|nr:hypothetical protein [Nocardia macrotermitis]